MVELARLLEEGALPVHGGTPGVLVALIEAPEDAAGDAVELHAARQLVHQALHRVWAEVPGERGEEITASVERGFAQLRSGSPPRALSALWRVVCFALGADGAESPSEEDTVTLSLLGNVFGRQLGSMDPAEPGVEPDPAAVLALVTGVAKWLGVIAPDEGEAELVHAALSFRAEVGALRLHRPAAALPGVKRLRFASAATGAERRDEPADDLSGMGGGHLGILSGRHVHALARQLETHLARLHAEGPGPLQ